MDKNMETTILGYTGITIRIHSFIPSKPKVSIGKIRVLHGITRLRFFSRGEIGIT